VTSLPLAFRRDYAAALANQLANPGEPALHGAYELGRRALNEGLSVIDLILLHHDTLFAFMADNPAEDDRNRMAEAAEFLAECLSPFEMTLLGYRDANLRLTTLNDRLERANREIHEAHEQLTVEIAERQRAEDALVQAQRLQVVGRLAGGIAHHFNNLLTVVLGNLDAATRLAGEAKLAQLLTIALRAAERGAAVTRQLLTFSRQQILNPEIVEPATRLREFATLLGGTLRGDIAIETDLPARLWPIKIDAAQLELALLNLALNARDAMAEGGVLRLSAVNRTIRDRRLGLAGDFLVIEIADTGCGIPAEVLPRVFEPFFTTKDVGAGTGLGLSQVHGFAHQSGGAVDIDSAPGQGTRVRLYLPASGGVASAAVAEDPPHEHRAAGTVLVVEDDLDVADLTANSLEHCGFSVLVAHRARAALDLLREGKHIDLVLSDIIMPDGMSGLELAAEIRSRFPAMPVLLTTGYSEALADATTRGLQIIAKPYRIKELCDCVTELLVPPPGEPPPGLPPATTR
jgi:signal transduction histidine kinase